MKGERRGKGEGWRGGKGEGREEVRGVSEGGRKRCG